MASLLHTAGVKSVTELTEYLRVALEGDPNLHGVWVRGEVSNLTRAASGHIYFTVKDGGAQLKCVMWKSAAIKQSFTPQNGAAVEAYGFITVYAQRGEYQLQAERVRPVGIGDLYARFEALKAQLAAEGLFDAERKRPLPVFPLRIGVVTSPDAAAFQDVLNVLRRRFPLGQVILSPSQVQGVDAPAQLVRALQRLNAYGEVDVILLCRGGGSLEDLWCFNDESVARAVAASVIPVVTGVGHEVDFTMVDFVSDYRAPTPSAGAEVITQYCAVDDLRAQTHDLALRLQATLYDSLAERRDALISVQRAMQYSSPTSYIRGMRQTIDALNLRMTAHIGGRLTLLRERSAGRAAALHAANPAALLARGYALVTLPDGTRVTSVGAAQPATRLHLTLQDGTLPVRVESQDALNDTTEPTQRPLL